jgi:hypothetical protein
VIDEQVTIHNRSDLPPGEWYGCEHPERPWDPGIRWHLDPSFCRPCHVRYPVDRLHMPAHHRSALDEHMLERP